MLFVQEDKSQIGARRVVLSTIGVVKIISIVVTMMTRNVITVVALVTLLVSARLLVVKVDPIIKLKDGHTREKAKCVRIKGSPFAYISIS